MSEDKVVSLKDWSSRRSGRKPSQISLAGASEPLRELVQATVQGAETEGKAHLLSFIDAISMRDKLERLIERHEGKIEEHRALVRSYADEQIQGLMAKVTDADLRMRPYFYFALSDEAFQRTADTLFDR